MGGDLSVICEKGYKLSLLINQHIDTYFKWFFWVVGGGVQNDLFSEIDISNLSYHDHLYFLSKYDMMNLLLNYNLCKFLFLFILYAFLTSSFFAFFVMIKLTDKIF